MPRFSLNLNTGPGMTHHEGYDPDAEPSLLVHAGRLDRARARGPARRAAPVARSSRRWTARLVAAAARDSLDWWAGYDGGQAVLAACRAWAWATEQRWLSKGEAAAWAIARLDDPAPVIAALARRADPSVPCA